MHAAITLLIALNFTACQSKSTKKPANKAQSNTKSSPTNKSSDTNALVISDYPTDTIYPARILMAGGVFHEDEVDPKSARYEWKGLFKTDSNYYVGPTKIELKREFDAVLDKGVKKTGWGIYPSVHDTTIMLISGLNYLSNRPVQSIKLSKDYILPGEHEEFTFNGHLYTFFATGNQTHTLKERNPYGVSNYRLFLTTIIEGRTYKQLILSMASFDDTISTIQFLGDIDGDGRPDLIMDTTSDYNMLRPTLYLSKPAAINKLLKPVGWFVMIGC